MKRITVEQLRRRRGITPEQATRLELLRWLWDNGRIPDDGTTEGDETDHGDDSHVEPVG